MSTDQFLQRCEGVHHEEGSPVDEVVAEVVVVEDELLDGEDEVEVVVDEVEDDVELVVLVLLGVVVVVDAAAVIVVAGTFAVAFGFCAGASSVVLVVRQLPRMWHKSCRSCKLRVGAAVGATSNVRGSLIIVRGPVASACATAATWTASSAWPIRTPEEVRIAPPRLATGLPSSVEPRARRRDVYRTVVSESRPLVVPGTGGRAQLWGGSRVQIACLCDYGSLQALGLAAAEHSGGETPAENANSLGANEPISDRPAYTRRNSEFWLYSILSGSTQLHWTE